MKLKIVAVLVGKVTLQSEGGETNLISSVKCKAMNID